MKIYLLPILFISFAASAQKKDSALLQQFKFRTPNFTAVELFGNAGGYFNSGLYPGTGYSLQLNPGMRATTLVSTDKELSTFNYEIITSFGSTKTPTFTGTSNATDFNAKLSVSAQKRKYNGQKYFTIGYSGLGQYAYDKYTKNTTEKRNDILSNITYTVGAGKGRIENVTDAQMAYNILQDLKNNNLLNNDFSVDDANGLAKTITFINNIRLFDFRRKRIYELKQIDSFLQSKGLINEKSIDYFTSITDNWFYAFNQFRRHGKEKYITLTPILGLSNREQIFFKQPTDSTIQNKSESAGAILTIGIEKATAKNIHRQFTKGLVLQTVYGYGNTKNTFNNNVFQSSNSNLNSVLNAFLQFGYYPTTRTNINYGVSNVLNYDYDNSIIANLTSFNFDGNYFINYNTRVFATFNANYIVSAGAGNSIGNQFSSSFNIGFQHFIR